MNRSKSEIDLNQLLHDVPESTQEIIRGGTLIAANEADSTETQ